MPSSPKPVNLALQGGGAHGAFTWGVLDRLLDAPEIEIAGISGTSAGALRPELVEAFAPVTDFFALGPEIWREEDAVAALRRLIAPIR
ncbi:MAG: patatin-like phospholipase family protein, partial [Roseicyclus sp.]|nr:patatin-like phospholipase family protein [Roseicyclus sp.]